MPTDLPNLLTLSRIAAIPVLVVLAALRDPWADLAACVVVSAAAITDYFDGKLARERQQTSNFGRMLDPIADKLLVGAALMVLAGMGLASRSCIAGNMRRGGPGLKSVPVRVAVPGAPAAGCRHAASRPVGSPSR